MPERVVRNDEFQVSASELSDDAFFAGVDERRFASPDYTSAELGTQALKTLLERNGIRATELDLIICSAQLNDVFSPGVGTAIQHAVGATSAAVVQVDNGCCSWVSSIDMARAYIDSGRYRRVAVVTATNFVSRLPEFQRSSESLVLGDGASATLLVASSGEPTVLSVHERAFGENWGALRIEPDAVNGVDLPYWERGAGPLTVRFNKKMLLRLWEVAMERLPEAVDLALKEAGLGPGDVSCLLTHQPNTRYIDEWRKRCGIEPARSYDTLRHYGNMFQSNLPVTFAEARDKGVISTGDIVTFATFSHGGELASAMVWHWNG